VNDDFMTMQQQQHSEDDPMTDQSFLEFLSYYSTSEPTPSSLLLFQGHHEPEHTLSTTNKKNKRDSINNLKKPSTQSKVGQCEHPKHVYYRQEKPAGNNTKKAAATPRRGRPPKGTKSSEYLFSTSPTEHPYYPIVELSVRPLPKRLEAVVGKSNIKVCLTCLKRSDLDQDYIQDKAYIGPQHIYKKKK
jgi:hypothetical protein